jgi:hypothetical protein
MGPSGSSEASAFAREIEASPSMTVRLISFDGTRYTADFVLDGARDALGQVLDACHEKRAGSGR